jgi:hypothetical protein
MLISITKFSRLINLDSDPKYGDEHPTLPTVFCWSTGHQFQAPVADCMYLYNKWLHHISPQWRQRQVFQTKVYFTGSAKSHCAHTPQIIKPPHS